MGSNKIIETDEEKLLKVRGQVSFALLVIASLKLQ